MAEVNRLLTEPSDRVLMLTRIFDAPPPIVFKTWIDPEHLSRWWGPHGFKVVSCAMDVRIGGEWRLRMLGPEGADVRQHFIYREIIEPERLVFAYAFEDEAGVRGHETIVTVTFADLGGKTSLTVHQAIFESVEVRDDHIRGWGEALERGAAYAVERAQR
jgi:uncharacterized protein YndB with AHSA1/START domain